MRVAITGHTGGIGLAFFNYFTSKGHEVVGFSRSNGFPLPLSFSKIVSEVQDFDLFINNAHVSLCQLKFLKELHNTLPTITCGSMAADYKSESIYHAEKAEIEQCFRQLKKISNMPMLLLKMGYLENYTDRLSISYKEIFQAVDLWLDNSRVSVVEFDNIHYDKRFKAA